MLNILIDGPCTGVHNMQVDEQLFSEMESGTLSPTLRIYQWSPQCISLGYGQNPEELLNINACRKEGWDVIKRITGGGIVFHNTEELTYSLFLPLAHPALPKGIIPSCNYISNILIKALHRCGINEAMLAEHAGVESNRGMPVCFSRPTKYEVVVRNRKLIGSAQKRGARTLMQHGSICVTRTNNVTDLVKEPFEDTSIGITDILGANTAKEALIKTIAEQFKHVF